MARLLVVRMTAHAGHVVTAHAGHVVPGSACGREVVMRTSVHAERTLRSIQEEEYRQKKGGNASRRPAVHGK